MAPNERQEDEGRGGVSTIARPGVRRRPAAGVRPGTATGPRPAPDQDQRPAGLPGNARTAPSAGRAPGSAGAPSSARPIPHPVTGGPAARLGTAPRPRPDAPAAAPSGSHRLPFVILLCGLLGGALISALVISTTLAEGAFKIANLENSTSAQAKQLQSLEEEVAQAQSDPQIASRAAKLGMVGPGVLRFIDLKSGKTTTDNDPGWVGHVPGYYP
jgi:hypothetical protein